MTIRTNTRRQFIQTAVAGVGAIALPSVAQSGFPNRPIRLICPWPAGGSTDAVMRSLADSAGRALGGPCRAILVSRW